VGFEPGFVLYSSLIKTFGIDYFGWVIINTAIDLCVLQWFFRKYSSTAILPFFFFIAYVGLLMEFNLYRNMKGLDLFLLSIPYIYKKKILPYMLLNVVGFTMHSSSLLYLVLYFFIDKNINRILLWICFGVVNVMYIMGITLTYAIVEYLTFSDHILEKVVHYISKNEEYGFTFGYFERTIWIILLLANYKKLIKQARTNVLLINCACLYYFTFYLFSDSSVLVERIPLLFIFANWVLFVNVLKLNVKYRQLLTSYIYVIAFLKLTMSTSSVPMKYDNIITGIDSYENRKELYFKNSSK
jgi:hypothetical protein